MELAILNKVNKLWDEWDLRLCIMFSLFLQAFLVSFAPFRRQSRSTFLLFSIWSAYLLADWIAAVAIGLITQSQTDTCDDPSGNDQQSDILGFWSSFLLLHLGGPDSITSFALEDNEFWLRHLLGLVLQVSGAAYSVYLTLPNNRLWLPTMLVFVAGTMKYGERTYSLYCASSDQFGAADSLPAPEPGPDYEEASVGSAQPMQEQENSVNEGMTITFLKDNSDDIDQTKLLKVAYELFQSFKGLIVGFTLSVKVRVASQKSFLEAHYTSAFRAIEYELSIMYEALHTKAAVANSAIGYVFRLTSFLFIFGASLLFLLLEKNHYDQLDKFDIGLTYTLLIGAIVLETMSFILLISSDLTLGSLKSSKLNIMRCVNIIPSIVLKRRRWSGSVLQYNIISYCLNERPNWLYKFAEHVNGRGILDKIKLALFSSSEKVTEDVKEFIFNELKTNAEKIDLNSRGKKESDLYATFDYEEDLMAYEFRGKIFEYSTSNAEESYIKEILLYHLATQIYCHEEKAESSSESFELSSERKCKKMLKLLSNYTFYLMVTKPTMLSPSLGRWEEIFQDTVDDAKAFFDKYNVRHDHSEACRKMKERFHNGASEYESARAETRSAGSNKHSVFSEACILAKDLLSMGRRHSEKRLGDQWMFYLALAAMSCGPAEHAQQLSKGGELLTFMWLLANHLGFTAAEIYETLQQ